MRETGTATNMARRYARRQRGERLDAKLPHGHWKTTTFVAGSALSGSGPQANIPGDINESRL